ncbi:MAG: formate dehydrogenase subunit gamma [Gaiellaceae bacterium]|nr:formate dehydrogenase subunit gamma [Gaiellaceae bacterium]MDX6440646.1 formate dehydrogenase subunit gamma [Gaiellaceae bacterium]
MKFVRRFSRTERTLHWVNAAGFLLLLATGLILYLPRLSTVVGRRPLIKDIHLWGGIGWISALLIVIVLGDRGGLLRTARDLEVLKPSRLNVGQKINALLNAAFAVLFLVSGLLLWFGERDTRFRFTSTVLLHDILMYSALTLLVGHLYLALIHPATRHSLRGITRGTVREDWAERHYPRWAPPPAD